MNIIEIFESFALDFEASVQDDDWSRLGKYFDRDAAYFNVGSPDPVIEGREAILDYFRRDVSDFDRKFDSRTLVALSQPATDGDTLSRPWRCTYSLAGAPDLVVEGEARYLFENNRIKKLEEEPTAASFRKLEEWMRQYADRLQA